MYQTRNIKSIINQVTTVISSTLLTHQTSWESTKSGCNSETKKLSGTDTSQSLRFPQILQELILLLIWQGAYLQRKDIPSNIINMITFVLSWSPKCSNRICPLRTLHNATASLLLFTFASVFSKNWMASFLSSNCTIICASISTRDRGFILKIINYLTI